MGSQEKDPYPAPGLTSDKGTLPAAVGFLDLPEPVREDIYKLVLTVKHPVYLFQDFGQRIESFAPDKPKWWIALLYTNRQISSEAKAVLYGNNHFFLMDNTEKHGAFLQYFLGSIGSSNANSLSRLCIGLPVAEKAQGQPDTVTIREDSLECLSLVREQCLGLKTLEMQMCKDNYRLLAGAREEDAQLFCDALLRTDAQLKTISSVKKIIVRISINGVPPMVVDTMQGLAWVVVDG